MYVEIEKNQQKNDNGHKPFDKSFISNRAKSNNNWLRHIDGTIVQSHDYNFIWYPRYNVISIRIEW